MNNHPMSHHNPSGEYHLVCPQCEREFTADNQRIRFCSPECQKAHKTDVNRIRHNPAGSIAVTCPSCGIVIKTDNPRLVFCSKKCQQAAYNAGYYEQNKDAIDIRMKEYMREKRNSE